MSNRARFSISRIQTNKGTFRLQGAIATEGSEKHVSYESVEFMGTDGWCEMDLDSPHTKSLLAGIEDEVLSHVMSQYQTRSYKGA